MLATFLFFFYEFEKVFMQRHLQLNNTHFTKEGFVVFFERELKCKH